MAKTAKYKSRAEENDLGCGLMAVFFFRRRFTAKKKAELPLAPPPPTAGKNKTTKTTTYPSKPPKTQTKPPGKPLKKPSSPPNPNPPATTHPNKALYGAYTGNVMLLGQLKAKISPKNHLKTPLNHHFMTSKGGKNGHLSADFFAGNILRGPTKKNIIEPEILKSMGNEKYREGRFEEALTLYDQAISLDSTMASYYSNKSAALTGLNRLLEAVFACREAVRINPSYQNAHYRLAKLCLRLGEGGEALNHLRNSGQKANSKEISQAQALKKHVEKCFEAQKIGDWNKLLKECLLVFSTGADSAPQIYAMKAEALLKLQRHQEAYKTIEEGPNYENKFSTRFFGSKIGAYLLKIRAEIYMAAGRFEEAIVEAEIGVRIDPSEEMKMVEKAARAVASARATGNHLFSQSKFVEACVFYSQGLEQNGRQNAILLCNRAACRYKLGKFEKAVEDCSGALSLRPCYHKARLRRADCNFQLERWEAAIQDYESLIQENSGDERVRKVLLEARMQLKRQRGEDTKHVKFRLMS